MKTLKLSVVLCLGLVCPVTISVQAAAESPDTLKHSFENPPNSARPLVWWHWMGGNISKEGIKLDLDWMHRAGIGGFHAFEGSMRTPTIVERPISYMSSEWKDAFRYAVDIGAQYGMEMSVASSPGWSETGGPWVQPADGMKKLVWSETRVRGGTAFHGVLPRPPATVGPFQNVPVTLSPNKSFSPSIPEYYADSEVIAYRAPRGDVAQSALRSKITTSSGRIDGALLSDRDLVKPVLLPAALAGQQAWIQYEFQRPQTIRAVSLAMEPPKTFADSDPSPMPILEAGDDGINFRKVCDIKFLRHGFSPRGNVTQTTVAFSPVKARFYRVVWTTPQSVSNNTGPSDHKIAELLLSPGARVHHFEEKDGFSTVQDLNGEPTPERSADGAIAKRDVVNLTGNMRLDGRLDWVPPKGSDWVILRFGYSLTGAKNSPAPPEATGIEVDKLDRFAVRRYLDHYLDYFKDDIGKRADGRSGLQYVLNDSWEAGNQNWTGAMVEKFTKLRGYDPRPWMPVLAGRVVVSAAASDRFLWDFRKTIGNLIVTEHYGELDAALQARGLGRYSESHEGFRGFVADGMEIKKNAQVPMGALWAREPGRYETDFSGNADDQETASVAHIYGQNIAAAESMTTCDPSYAWAWSPATLKPIVDQEFLNGINRIVIHESAHQPLVDKAPGMTVGPCGQWFNRNETWAEQAKAWTGYLSRVSFMLQQGRFAADVLYFYGEDTNITARFGDSAPDVPAGYRFDFINADGLIHELSVDKGRIKTRSGMTYRVLVLDSQTKYLSLAALRAIRGLVEQGGIVIGEKPIDTPSLADDRIAFKRLNDSLFGSGAGVRKIGLGAVYVGESVADVLHKLKVAEDFKYDDARGGGSIKFIHRILDDGDIYFLNNRSDHAMAISGSFRVAGKAPEFWDPETGKIAPASYAIADGRTAVPLELEPWNSVIVVFRKPATVASHEEPKASATVLATMDGGWKVAFQQGRGAPETADFPTLSSWTNSNDAGIKYFSGTAIYTKKLRIRPEWLQRGGRVWLDLGWVGNLAAVRVNGKEIGTVWHKPYRIDVGSALKAGVNDVEVSVTNSWMNRLIGDLQPDAKTHYTFATWPAYSSETRLPISGLIGPVQLILESR